MPTIVNVRNIHQWQAWYENVANNAEARGIALSKEFYPSSPAKPPADEVREKAEELGLVPVGQRLSIIHEDEEIGQLDTLCGEYQWYFSYERLYVEGSADSSEKAIANINAMLEAACVKEWSIEDAGEFNDEQT